MMPSFYYYAIPKSIFLHNNAQPYKPLWNFPSEASVRMITAETGGCNSPTEIKGCQKALTETY